jgi:predicted outer membrane repeat protein
MKYFSLSLLFLFAVSFARGVVSDTLSFQIENSINDRDLSLPFIDLTFDLKLSDISICKGPGKVYYVTGTQKNSEGVQEGIMVWASRDLKEWNLVGRNNGYVWKFDTDGAEWQKEISLVDGIKKRAIVSPSIHYMHNTFWITYTNSNSNKSGILKSRSGRAYGPYDELKPDGFMVSGGNSSLFMDTDSTVYFIWGSGQVHQMLTDMSGFSHLSPRNLPLSGYSFDAGSGIKIQKFENNYYVSGSRYSIGNYNLPLKDTAPPLAGRFDGVLLKSGSLFGSYSQHIVVPHGANGSVFTDFDERLWYVFSSTGKGNPLGGAQAFLPLTKNNDGHLVVDCKKPFYPGRDNQVVYVSREGSNSNGTTWNTAYTSLQRAVDNAPVGSQLWIAAGTYDGPVEINLHEGLYLMGGFKGNETELWQRDARVNKTIINGYNEVKNVLVIKSSNYIRLDGLTIRGGNARKGSNFQQYGGGLHLLGGGQTIRIVNCTFENNSAELDGGALYASIGASPLIINCTFKNNTSRNNGGAIAVYCNTHNGYNARLYNSIFENNYAYGNGGAVYFNTNKQSSGILTLLGCLFHYNETRGVNGTVALDGNADLLIANSTFSFNKGNVLGAAIGKLGNVPGKSRIVNSIFYKNSGQTLFKIEGEAEIYKTSTSIGYPNIWVQFISSLFYGNDVKTLVQRNFDKKVWQNTTDLNSSVMGLNCIENNPVFVNPDEGNFKLSEGSGARGEGVSTYFLPYTLDGILRNQQKINIGCY